MTVPGLIRECPDMRRILGHIQALEGIRHPVTAPAALEQAADYIAATLTACGGEVTEHCFADNGGLFRNIVATRRGSLHPDKRVLLMAHYDTVAESPGADDNASGVAVLLEIAALLATLRFELTVQFVGVSLEENAREGESGSGTRGSRALANHAREQGWDIAGVIVLESVAYAGTAVVQTAPPGLTIPVPEIGDFIAVVGNERSKGLLDGCVRALGRLDPALPHVALTVPANGEMLPDTRRSDHAPFWDAGFPAIMLTDTTNFRNPNYHRASDTRETLNLEFAARVCAATAALVADLARALPPE